MSTKASVSSAMRERVPVIQNSVCDRSPTYDFETEFPEVYPAVFTMFDSGERILNATPQELRVA